MVRDYKNDFTVVNNNSDNLYKNNIKAIKNTDDLVSFKKFKQS